MKASYPSVRSMSGPRGRAGAMPKSSWARRTLRPWKSHPLTEKAMRTSHWTIEYRHAAFVAAGKA